MDNQDQLSDAEKIRLKRLARLGGSNPATPPPQAGAGPSQSSSPSEQSQTNVPTPRPPASASSRLLNTPTAPAVTSARATPAPKAEAAAVTAPAPNPAKRPAPSTTPSPATLTKPPQPSPAPTQPKIAYSAWEIDAVSSIFSATLTKKEAESSDWKLCWLVDLANELDEEGIKPVTTPDLADRILIARLSLEPDSMASSDNPDVLTVLAGLPQDETVFEYLTGCWRRLYAKNREFLKVNYSPEEKNQWHSVVAKLKSLIMSYSGMTLEDPTMFPQPSSRPTGPAEFLPVLLALAPTSVTSGDPLTSTSSNPGPASTAALQPAELVPFLNDLAAHTQDVLTDVLSPTLSLFFQQWFSISPSPDLLGSEWRNYLGAIVTLVQVKAIASTLPALSIWVAPNVDAPKLEWQSLLGPLIRLNVYPREFAHVWKTYFSNPTDRKTADIDANKSNLRHTLGALQNSLFNIFNSIVRASPDSREAILKFFALVVQLNSKRAGMSVPLHTVSSDGYMSNLQFLLLKLFEPVMDVNFSKIDKVDPDYYRSSQRINISEETRIKAAKEDVDAYNAMEVDPSTPNFISDLFFLLSAFHHLGLVKTISTRIRAEKNIGEIEKELKRAEASREQWAGNPALETQGQAVIDKLKGDLATLHASIHAYDTQLLDPTFVRLNINYVTFLMTWLIRLVDPNRQYPRATLQLPLPEEAPIQFRMLPEYLIENVSEYLDFLSRYSPESLDKPDKDVVVEFVIVFLSPGYINNPFLKAKLVSILAHGLYPVGYYRNGTLYDTLTLNPMATTHLMPSLIRFFIDVEHTGGHTQFWDKFNFRRDMSRIIRSMWNNSLHREAFVKARHDDFDQFIKFVNMLMSDTTFHLEESLTSLATIYTIRTAQADETAWNALPQNDRQDQEGQLRQAEQQAPFHTTMGLDHVELLRDFTATTKEPFVTREIVDRLAATLDENLATLVGPKMQELRVSDPKKFGFEPKRLLAGIAQIYLNLSQEADFIRAVANDGRSYSKEVFERFARVLKHRGIMTESEVSEVVSFTQKVEDMKATIVMEDEREIPDEFLDPLLSTLMVDPVILPMSRQVVDRSTIRTVLLSKEQDPFNNMPLKLEDCVPDTELKARIDAWLSEGSSHQAERVMDVDSL